MPTPEPEVIKLIAHTTTPAVAPPGQVLAEWSEKVMEMSGGRVEVVTYFSSALFEQREAIRSLLAGTADVHFDYMVGEDPGLMALNFYFDLPFLGWNTSENALKVEKELYKRFPEMTEEFQGLKVLYILVANDANWMMTTNKQVQTSEDLKGMKFISHGYAAKWYQLMGATPVKLSWPDFYTSMEKGVVDATLGSFGAHIASGMIELTNYYTLVPTPMRMGFFHQLMNPDSFNGLPPDIQKILLDLEPWVVGRRLELEKEMDKIGVPMAEELGATFVELSPEVTQEWIDAASPVHEEWISAIEGQGKPARALYDELMKLLEEYK
jgi:TRAP-type C4-dicarboxylate transport system substrate-binding protein